MGVAKRVGRSLSIFHTLICMLCRAQKEWISNDLFGHPLLDPHKTRLGVSPTLDREQANILKSRAPQRFGHEPFELPGKNANNSVKGVLT